MRPVFHPSRPKRVRFAMLSVWLFLAVLFATSGRNAYAQSEAPSEMMEVHIFDATDHRHHSSMLARSLFSVATKFSRRNILTVVDLNATDVEMRAAMQSQKTIAMFVGGHGSSDGVMVDGNGYAVGFEVFMTAPSSSVRFVECAGCNGEKIARNYAVPPGVKLRHGQGKVLGHEMIGALNAFPDHVEAELRKQSPHSAMPSSADDPFAKAYPKGDIYVLEKASETSSEASEIARAAALETMIDWTLQGSMFARASRAGYRVLVYRGDSYEAVAKYALSQNRVAGLLLRGPPVQNSSHVPVTYVSRELSDAEKAALKQNLRPDIDFETAAMMAARAEPDARNRKFRNSIDSFLGSVIAKRGAVIGLCQQLFIRLE